MSAPRRATASGLLAVTFLLAASSPAWAATAAIDLGTASSFAVLAGSGITNTGPTTITGDVGTFPTTSMSGFGSVTLAGVNHGGDAVTQDAKQALRTAYVQAAGSGPAAAVATELGGRTLTPGVYHGGTLAITGALTLDTQGDPDAVFVFQSDATLVTASASSVVVLGGGTACNVFWQVGSSATFGADATLVGTVIADTSISAGDGATFQGRLLALGGAVTLQRNTITARTCAASAGVVDPAAAAVPDGGPAAAAIPTDPTETATADPGGSGTPVGAPVTGTPVGVPVGTTTGTTLPATRRSAPSTPTGGTATSDGRPPLARTGPTDWLPLLGSSTTALGLLLGRATRARPNTRTEEPACRS